MKKLFLQCLKKYSSDIFAFIAIAVSIVIGLQQCNQANKLEGLTSRVNSLVFQPRIIVKKPPKIGKILFDKNIDSIKIPPYYYSNGRLFIDSNRFRIKSQNGTTIISPKKEYIEENTKMFYDYIKHGSDTVNQTLSEMNLRFPIKIELVNIGNSLGKLILYSISDFDSISGAPKLRRTMLDLVSGNDKIKPEPEYWSDFFNNVLLPFDSVTIDLEFRPRFISDGKINLHFMILYENELGIISDSYFWVVYDNFPEIWKEELIYDTNRIGMQYKLLDDPKERLKIISYKKDFKVYSEEDSKKITEWILESLDSLDSIN